jgi:glycosyltransferase involved in cell wall biosynthesis
MTPILLNWQASNLFAWGIVGLHIFEHWALRDDVCPVMGAHLDPSHLPLGAHAPHGREKLRERIELSNRFANDLAAAKEAYPSFKLNIPVVHALGNRYTGATNASGKRNIGRIVFEDTFLDAASQSAQEYDLFTCISEWNAELLREDTDKPVVTIHEGVDTRRFHPGPRTHLFGRGRFLIYSGGKVEFRKGQDQVLLAFRAFHARHPDSVLVVAWQSPWQLVGTGFKGRLEAPLHRAESGALDIPRWCAENGVDPGAVIDLGLVPNTEMPAILREMDCALVASRCEGGTSLVAMEAMASGVPTIIANNTGLRDIVGDDRCIVLRRQTPTEADPGEGRYGWCDSDIEEIVEALELLYSSSERRAKLGAAGAAFIGRRTWAGHAERLREAVFSL